ncbi:DUF4362 domain-containing protein [Paenibacillus sp. HWE-109]|nr:DUF4362 domain-containing protein [Paenibacillus sp. HWE-109]UKS31281.1 DUF4362 domain-containing protein [Paenibacillus sp. HWE-109]
MKTWIRRNLLRLSVFLILLVVLGYTYSTLSNGHVIPDDKYMRVIRMEKFIDRFYSQKGDQLFIIHTTIEGGFVPVELVATRQEIKLIQDNSWDMYATQEKESIICKNIKREIRGLSINYNLNQCYNLSADQEISVISLGIK